MTYSEEEKQTLKDIALASIESGLENLSALQVNPEDYSKSLQKQLSCFVTLKLSGDLRGCIGSLTARQPLVCDVAEHAHAAAFHDPRFPNLTEQEFNDLDISISVLSESEEIGFNSEEDLLKKIRPNVDGLTLIEDGRRGTFLPAVWESLPDPQIFLSQLKVKAGLPADYWSDSIIIKRYTTESF